MAESDGIRLSGYREAVFLIHRPVYLKLDIFFPVQKKRVRAGVNNSQTKVTLIASCDTSTQLTFLCVTPRLF